MSSASPIPVVDLSARQARVTETIRDACERIGFFCITGHGAADHAIEGMYRASRDFFDLAESQKRRVGSAGDVLGGLMYFPMESERLAASRGEETPADIKETLDHGPGFYGDVWPDDPVNLRGAWIDYYRVMSDLASRLRRIFALAIGLPETYFEPFFGRHHSSLRVLNYPDQNHPPIQGQLRAGAHSDYGFLTILRSEASSGGLQAQRRDGRWIDVPVVPGGFVVNIGDALMRWTNDHWTSTVHRVVNPPADERTGTRRQSIAFFHNPNIDAVIDCLDLFSGQGKPKYPAVTYGEYADTKYRLAHRTN